MSSTIKFYAAAFALFALGGCSGGGGGVGTDGNTSTAPLPEPVTVGVLLTDAAGTRWDQAFATITSIELIGDDYHQTIFTGNETVEILSLPDYSELFTLADDVLPGHFSKIRLHLSSLELVDLDDTGAEVERVNAKLVGNGKIDINPRTTITMAGGDVLLIELDFDMNKAFKTTETGNGQTIVRPVIFARIMMEGGSNRMTRVFGVVQSTDMEAQTFVLCQTGLYADRHDDDEDEHDSGRQRCVVIAADDRTGVFRPDGLPATFADVLVGSELTAVGFLRHDDADADDDHMGAAESEGMDDHDIYDDFVLDAVVVELGTDFRRYSGTADSAVDGDFFEFALGPNQGFEPDTVIATQLFASTRIFSKSGEELDSLAIVAGLPGIVDGVVVAGAEGMSDTLSAALIVVDPTAATPEDYLSGEIISVLESENSFQLLVGEATRCIDATAAEILLVTAGETLSSEPGTLADLSAGMLADVYGEEGMSGCFVASKVMAMSSSSP